jgi:hypothetical protein
MTRATSGRPTLECGILDSVTTLHRCVADCAAALVP